MKIAFVSDSIYPYNKGGKEKRLFEISTRLAKRGHDVHIYTMHWWKGSEKVTHENGLTLHALSKLYPLYSNNRRSMRQALMFGFACLKLGSVKCDVMDVDHMPYFPIFGAWFSRIIRGKQIFGTWHEALTFDDWRHYMGPSGIVAGIIERISIHLPHAVSVASPHTLELIESKLHRRKRLALVTSGVDLELIKKVKASRHAYDVLTVGRLVKDKNTAMLIEAVDMLRKSFPAISCLIIGKGPERSNLDKLIKDRGLSQHITIVEQLPEASDIYATMKSCRVFALPSYREGFGIVAVEAMACGSPVVTIDTTANSAKSLITSANGIVARPTVDGVAEAITHLLRNPLDARTVRKSPVIYDWKSITDLQLEAYTL